MNVIKRGVKPKDAWKLRCRCGSCGSELEVVFEDIFKNKADIFKNDAPDQRDYCWCHYKYACGFCGVHNIISNQVPDDLKRLVMRSKPPRYTSLQPTET